VRENAHKLSEIPFQEPTTKRVPKGTSSYQAAWILEDDDQGEVIDSDDEMIPRPLDNSEEEEDTEYEDINLDSRSVHYDELNEEENEKQYLKFLYRLKEYLQREKEAREQSQFPDEIDTPQFLPASQRFARYRGLKSFRSSPWDPYENLPLDYSRIFQFQNFKRSKKKVFDNVAEDGISPGTRVTVEIGNVPKDMMLNQSDNRIFSIFGLFEYEHKFTVMNFTVQRNQKYDGPVKSKDTMILMSGFKRYIVNPIYSTYSRGGPNNVHKFERYLQQDKTYMATIYAPVQFGPCPILMFKCSTSNWTEGKFDIN
jgi:pre-rRNA-processing protein TSR1